jgi:hypothetical protein
MYQLLFRSRWFALAWVLMMAVSAVVFTTTGAGALLTATTPRPGTSEAASDAQSRYRSWAEDENRQSTGDQGFDPSRPDQLRDGTARDETSRESQYNTVPYSGSDSENAGSGTDNGAGK